MRRRKDRLTLVGTGRLAHALITILPRAGYALDEIVSRSGGTSEALKEAKRQGVRRVSFTQARFGGDIVWLAVRDSAIRACATSIAGAAKWKNKIVLHSSGALSSDELEPLRKKGAKVASVHPMMTFVAGKVPNMQGVGWAVEGDPEAVRVAKKIARDLGGTVLHIDKENKPLYHAFGAFLSPLLVVQMEQAAELAIAAGIPRAKLSGMMEPIVRQTLSNLFAHLGEKRGAGKAFSGPLVRGDVGTIEKHLKVLKRNPTARKLYRALVETATESDLPVENRKAIRRLLQSSG